MDFSIIKRTLNKIADHLDHRVLLPRGNPHVTVEDRDGTYFVNHHGKYYQFPEEDVLVLDLDSLTAEHLSGYILQEFMKNAKIPENIVKISAGIDEGPGQGAWSSVEL